MLKINKSSNVALYTVFGASSPKYSFEARVDMKFLFQKCFIEVTETPSSVIISVLEYCLYLLQFYFC